MGGEGHVFDMIQRAKQNRKMIQDRRDRMKDLVEMMKRSTTPVSCLLFWEFCY